MTAAEQLYPLKFAPLYMMRMWGGNQLGEVLQRDVPRGDQPIGESWELVDRPDEQSVVVNGELAGKTLQELVRLYGDNLVGPKAQHAGRFPLLVKLIDAGERLSLQVHPEEATCRELGNGAEPKTEMWYIIAARKGAKILAGLSPRTTRVQLTELLNSPEVENLLQVYPSQPGDAYFITSGTLHAIGGGNLILEIQQNSDTTYRVSDWGRVDQYGRPRELHVEQGLKSINFMNRTSPRIAGASDVAAHNRKFPLVNQCRFFQVDVLLLVDTWYDDTVVSGSFHLVSAINGEIKLVGLGEKAPELILQAGETALVPYAFGKYCIIPLSEGEVRVVRTTL